MSLVDVALPDEVALGEDGEPEPVVDEAVVELTGGDVDDAGLGTPSEVDLEPGGDVGVARAARRVARPDRGPR